jgi:ABC-type uncharacterized transport system fused permease/ATPase subunit
MSKKRPGFSTLRSLARHLTTRDSVKIPVAGKAVEVKSNDQPLHIDDKGDLVDQKFRLLIIGKSGCGKTTILSKVRSFNK